jgi:hypothetical protein
VPSMPKLTPSKDMDGLRPDAAQISARAHWLARRRAPHGFGTPTGQEGDFVADRERALATPTGEERDFASLYLCNVKDLEAA